MEPLRCRKCHKLLPEGSVFCMYCGNKVIPEKAKSTHRSPKTGSLYKMSGKRKKPWVVLAPSSDGRRKTIGTFSTQIEAEKALLDYLGSLSERRDWTVEQFYKAYISSGDFQQLKPGSQTSHKTAWSYFGDVANMRMSDLKTSHLQRIINDAVEKGRKRSTSEKIRNLASILCQEAMRDDVINKNYAALLSMPKNDAETKDVFTAEEIAILKAHDSDYRAKLILILIYTGMRVSELLELKNSNIDTETWHAIGGLKTEAGKNRIIPIIPTIRPYVESLMSGHELLVHKDGAPMRREYFEKYVFKRYLIELNILKEPKEGENWRLSPHSTRHTLTTLARKAGIKEDVIARIVGHTTYETTDKHYVQMDAIFLGKELEKVENANEMQTNCEESA